MTDTMQHLNAVFAAVQAGRASEALSLLEICRAVVEARRASEWWRLKGLAHAQLADWRNAEAAYERAVELAPLRSELRGAALVGYGSLLGTLNRRQDAMRAYLGSRDAYRSARHDEGLVLAAYNLGWSLLQLSQVDAAAAAFEEVLLAAERPSGAYNRPFLHLGRSLVASLRGDHQLAISGARWTAQQTTELTRVRALRRLAEEEWLVGDETGARQTLTETEAMPACRNNRQQHLRIILLLAMLSGNEVDVRGLLPSLSLEDRTKALLFLADRAWQARWLSEARQCLEEACALHQPHAMALMSPRLADLYNWGSEEGFALPTPVGRKAPREIRIHVRGAPRLEVNGDVVSARLSPQAAAVGAYLAEHGPVTAERLTTEALGAQQTSELTRAVQRLCLLIGDPVAVRAETAAGERRWHLSDTWIWQVDAGGRGRLLGGLDSAFTQALEQREQNRPAAL